jgi:hypothetical protein
MKRNIEPLEIIAILSLLAIFVAEFVPINIGTTGNVADSISDDGGYVFHVHMDFMQPLSYQTIHALEGITGEVVLRSTSEESNTSINIKNYIQAGQTSGTHIFTSPSHAIHHLQETWYIQTPVIRIFFGPCKRIYLQGFSGNDAFIEAESCQSPMVAKYA